MEQHGFGAIDLGTSGVRALVFTPQGRVAAEAARELPGRAEADPDQVVEGALAVLREAVHQASEAGLKVEAVGLSSALFSVMGVDGHGRPVTPAYTWMDRRAGTVVARHREKPKVRALYQRTGCPMHALYPVAKVRWLRETDPERFQRVSRFISLKEYLLHRLFGQYVVDVSVASSSGYFDITNHRWDPDALAWAGITEAQLSEPVDATHVLRGMDPGLATWLGLSPGTPVVVGAGDGMLAHVASGCVTPERFSCTVGTSGAIRVLAGRPLLDPEQRTWCYCLDRSWWVAGGAVNNGGVVLRWLRDILGCSGSEAYHAFNQMAAQVPPGARGLIWVPLLTGERSPRWNDLASGVLVGLRLEHGRAELVRAAMEGVVFRLLQAYEVLAALAGVEGELRASGGYARSALWLQIQADAFGRPVLRLKVPEASAMGAAIAAMKAVGAVDTWQAAETMVDVEERVEPRPEFRPIYQHLFDLFQKAYTQALPLFGELAALGQLDQPWQERSTHDDDATR